MNPFSWLTNGKECESDARTSYLTSSRFMAIFLLQMQIEFLDALKLLCLLLSSMSLSTTDTGRKL